MKNLVKTIILLTAIIPFSQSIHAQTSFCARSTIVTGYISTITTNHNNTQTSLNSYKTALENVTNTLTARGYTALVLQTAREKYNVEYNNYLNIHRRLLSKLNNLQLTVCEESAADTTSRVAYITADILEIRNQITKLTTLVETEITPIITSKNVR